MTPEKYASVLRILSQMIANDELLDIDITNDPDWPRDLSPSAVLMNAAGEIDRLAMSDRQLRDDICEASSPILEITDGSWRAEKLTALCLRLVADAATQDESQSANRPSNVQSNGESNG